MKHITIPAGTAVLARAGSRRALLPGMGSVADQPYFAPVLRRQVMSAVNICGKRLGLGASSIVVLDALLSCLPCTKKDGADHPVTSQILLTVYASNAALCERARGMSDRQLRRQLEILEQAGLLLRRDSANGKRFPIMAAGKAIGAFGIDLSPLFVRAENLLALADICRLEADELRGLRARLLQLRQALMHQHLDEDTATLIQTLPTILRRATLTLDDAKAMLSHLTALAAEPQAIAAKTCEPVIWPASDGQNDRHKKTESQTNTPHTTDWNDLTTIREFYPEPTSLPELKQIAVEFGRMLRLSNQILAKAMGQLGPTGLLKQLDTIGRYVETIKNPEAWLQSCLSRHPDRGQVSASTPGIIV